MIFLDTTYLLGIQLSDRMLFDVEERRQGILYMRNDLLHEILGDDDEDPGHVLATFHVLDDLIGQGQYEMVFPYDIFLHIDPYTHEPFVQSANTTASIRIGWSSEGISSMLSNMAKSSSMKSMPGTFSIREIQA